MIRRRGLLIDNTDRLHAARDEMNPKSSTGVQPAAARVLFRACNAIKAQSIKRSPQVRRQRACGPLCGIGPND